MVLLMEWMVYPSGVKCGIVQHKTAFDFSQMRFCVAV